MEIKEKAAIGIGVPLGVICAFILVAFISLNIKKRRRAAAGIVEDVELEDHEAPKHREIQWKPYG